jgi:hypothetical protein
MTLKFFHIWVSVHPAERRGGRDELLTNLLCVLRASAVSFLLGQFRSALIHRHQIPVAMLDGFSRHLHAGLRGEDETVA